MMASSQKTNSVVPKKSFSAESYIAKPKRKVTESNRKNKIQFFLMTRRGTFKAKGPTNNQCKVKGHQGYNYTIKLIVEGVKESLDQNDFILDHVDVDKFIQTCGLKGSCENMQLIISSKFPKYMSSLNVNLLGYCCRIIPVMPKGEEAMAFMEYVKVMNGDNSILPMLSIV